VCVVWCGGVSYPRAAPLPASRGGNIFFQNIGKHLPDYTASPPVSVEGSDPLLKSCEHVPDNTASHPYSGRVSLFFRNVGQTSVRCRG
jgi:hypothetical protein